MGSIIRQEASRMSLVVGIIAALAAIGCAVESWADAYPPEWRGSSGTTYQEWAFTTNSNPSSPDWCSNPFAAPRAAIDYHPPWGSGWYNTLPAVYGSAQGWWDIAMGSVALSVVNRPDIPVDVWKDITVRVVYWKDINLAPNVVIAPSATLLGKTSTLVLSGPVGGGWYADLWNFHIDPNRSSESITIAGHPSMGSQIDSVAVDTRYAASLASAGEVRTLPEGTVIELTGPCVTRTFDTFFYMENLDRSAGIRVNCAGGQSPPPEGTSPKVTGVLRTIDGERLIDQASTTPWGNGSVLPLGMNCRAVRVGLTPQGILVYLWGRASVAFPTATSFTLSDGSPEGVPVQLYGVAPPTDGAYIVVSGILGANPSGPLLRVGLSDTVRATSGAARR